MRIPKLCEFCFTPLQRRVLEARLKNPQIANAAKSIHTSERNFKFALSQIYEKFNVDRRPGAFESLLGYMIQLPQNKRICHAVVWPLERPPKCGKTGDKGPDRRTRAYKLAIGTASKSERAAKSLELYHKNKDIMAAAGRKRSRDAYRKKHGIPLNAPLQRWNKQGRRTKDEEVQLKVSQATGNKQISEIQFARLLELIAMGVACQTQPELPIRSQSNISGRRRHSFRSRS